MIPKVRCYLVLVHGIFDYHVKPLPSGMDFEGFFAGRSVLARNKDQAKERAFSKVETGLAEWNADIRDGLVSIRLEAEDVSLVPFWYALRRVNRGHTFYGGE